MRMLTLALAAAGLVLSAAPQPPETVPADGVRASRLAPLSARLEALDFYGSDESLNVRFTLTNTTSRPLWVLRWSLPGAVMDGPMLRVTRDGEDVGYEGRLVKRAQPEAEDYLELQPGASFSIIFDPSAQYDMALQGRYRMDYAVDQLQVRHTAPETRNLIVETSLLRRRDSQETALPTLDTAPQGRVALGGTASAEFAYQGIPGGRRPAVVEMVIGGYSGCTSSQQTALKTAHSNAISISGKALSHLNANPSGSTLATYWFGAFSSTRYATVKSHFTKINGAFQNQSVVYDCSCKDSAYAYVYPSQPYRIYLCKAYWSAPSLGRDSKAGTLVHEMSHFTVNGGTQDYVYGATGAHSLALSSPAKAVMNADNHEYFAEDQK